jgi:hypothetical protein
LNEQLQLTPRQADRLQEIQEKNEGAPGALWLAAAELQESLSSNQKEQLFASLDQQRPGGRTGSGFGRADGARFMRRGFQENDRNMPSLDLTDDQKEQLETLRDEQRERVEAMRAQVKAGNLEQSALREQLLAQREQMRSALEQILTKDQLAKLDARRQGGDDAGARSGRRVQRIDRAAAADRRSALLAARNEVLELTSEQKQTLKELREKQQAALAAFQDNARSEGKDRQSLMTEFQSLRESFEAETEAIYTDKQLEIIMIHRSLSIEAFKQRDEGPNSGGQRRPGRFRR